MLSKLKTIIIFLFLFFPLGASAHMPVMVKDNFAVIEDPLVAHAFYVYPEGATTTFQIAMEKDFNLYTALLIPNAENSTTSIFAKIYREKEDGEAEEVAFLDGSNSNWHEFYEKFCGNSYLSGPEFAGPESSQKDTQGVDMPAGNYSIEVYSPGNNQRFILAVGDEEIFDPKAAATAAQLPLMGQKDFSGLSILNLFFGQETKYLLIPVAIIFLFLSASILITIKQVRDKLRHLGH